MTLTLLLARLSMTNMQLDEAIACFVGLIRAETRDLLNSFKGLHQ